MCNRLTCCCSLDLHTAYLLVSLYMYVYVLILVNPRFGTSVYCSIPCTMEGTHGAVSIRLPSYDFISVCM